MQCTEDVYRVNKSADKAVQYLNHSCGPNCGVQGLFDFVVMRDIKAGEEITTDYAMRDDSNW
jgi:SET domain-containing protein